MNGKRDVIWRRSIGMAVAVWVGCGIGWSAESRSDSPGRRPEPGLDVVLRGVAEAGRFSIEQLNLACAQGLGGSVELSPALVGRELETMAAAVRRETERLLPRYRGRPGVEARSEAEFRMRVLVTVLQQDFRVRYHPERAAANAAGPESSSAFFRDAADIFLHGAAGERRLGTCSSLPVLYAAVGRRLGYPLKLVKARAHLFLRWDSTNEKFNIETTSIGYVSHPDEYYRYWPMAFDATSERSERFLVSLDPGGEVAVFLINRALCLAAQGRFSEGAGAVEAAVRWDPVSADARGLLESLRSRSRVAPPALR